MVSVSRAGRPSPSPVRRESQPPPWAWVVSLLLLITPGTARAAPQPPGGVPSHTIVYGGNNSSPPFEFLDAAGTPQGFNVELVRALARASGREVKVRLGVWKDIVAAVGRREVDLVTLGFAEGRAADFDFVTETWTLRQAAFFPPGRPAYPSRADQMQGEIVAVQLDSIVHELLRALPEAQRPALRPAPNHLEAVRLLTRREVTAVAGNSLVLRNALESASMPGVVEVPIKAASYQLATGRGRGSEMAWIEPALQRLKENGEYSRLVEKYLGAQRKAPRWPIFAGALAAALLVGAIGYVGARLWNASLRRQVAARTRELLASAEEQDRLAASLVEREKRLRKSEERYELAAEATRDVIWDWDFGTSRAIWSAGLTVAFGYAAPVDPVTGLWWEERLHPEDRERAVTAFQALLDGNRNRAMVEYRFRRADCTFAHITDRAIVVRGADGRPQRMIGAMTDISARKEAEAERERLIADLGAKNAELERFSYTVSHDLKSPLVTIGSYVGVLEKSVRAGDMTRFAEDVARIQRATDRLRRLLDELLELSRVGRVMNPPELVSLRDLAREAADLVTGRLAERNIEVLIADNLPTMRGDRVRLLEVMLNLIDNAAKFVTQGKVSSIEVGVSPDRPAPSFFVRDNGVGIEPQHHEKVFGLFDKLELSSEGTGIGLALVRRIVEAHGGRIWVDSAGRDAGTTFHITFGPASLP